MFIYASGRGFTVGGSQIPVMWQCISITIPLAKQVQLCKIYACLPLLHALYEKLLRHHPCSVLFVMNFENIVISPPNNYRFLNFVPSVINLYTFRKENLKFVWRSPLKFKQLDS